MGYHTDFAGEFRVTPTLRARDIEFLTKLSDTRRMARRDLPPEFGIEGEFYVDGGGFLDELRQRGMRRECDGCAGQDHEESIVDYNRPPNTQPSLWCDWTPSTDGTAIHWNGREKFYNYVEWIEYLIDAILRPRGYTLNGEVEWRGEDPEDMGLIVAVDNVITVRHGRVVYE